MEAEEGLVARLGRVVRLAAFLDVGGIYGTTRLEAGLRAGAGPGLRLLLGAATLRIDYAAGFGATLPEAGRGNWYIGLATSGMGRDR